MSDDTSALVHGYLDGTLTAEQEADLNSWIKSAPENAAAFARMVRLHDGLRDLIRADRVAVSLPAGPAEGPPSSAFDPPGRGSWRRAGLVGGLAALAATVLLLLWWGSSTRVSAATEINKLIEKNARLPDRSYVIRNLDPLPEEARDRQPPIDGAVLHVRSPDRYVLVRQFPDGRRFVTGSDGERSWAVPPDGAVRVSGDPMRFRGPVPGHQHGIPFADLRSDLVQFRDAYTLTVLGRRSDGWQGLAAEKKSAEHRGPRRVELWYDPQSGVIHRMLFAGMPRQRGGPDRVAVELLEQWGLGADFFGHEAHHAPNRRVILEDVPFN